MLANIRVESLSPSTASNIQPLDVGIVACVKNKYLRRPLFCVFDSIDVARMFIQNVKMATDMM